MTSMENSSNIPPTSYAVHNFFADILLFYFESAVLAPDPGSIHNKNLRRLRGHYKITSDHSTGHKQVQKSMYVLICQ
jgi:hypothetical protein